PVPGSPRPARVIVAPASSSSVSAYTTLFRSAADGFLLRFLIDLSPAIGSGEDDRLPRRSAAAIVILGIEGPPLQTRVRLTPLRSDRKSTRLNSSHVKISYAVFCLKKKKSLAH